MNTSGWMLNCPRVVGLALEPHVVRGDDGDPRGDGMFSTELSPSEGTCPRSAGPGPSWRLSSWGRPGGHITGAELGSLSHLEFQE